MKVEPSKVPLEQIPAVSTAFTAEPTLRFDGSLLAVDFEFDDDGVRKRSALVFEGVRAHVHRTEGASTSWHVQGAFDTLCEVLDSPWLEEIDSLALERGHAPGKWHHYLIYLDSAGCYEVVARTWAIAPVVLI